MFWRNYVKLEELESAKRDIENLSKNVERLEKSVDLLFKQIGNIYLKAQPQEIVLRPNKAGKEDASTRKGSISSRKWVTFNRDEG